MKTRAFLLSSLFVLSASAVMPARAQLFGESDEVKAARQAHEDGQDAQIRQNAQTEAQSGERIKALEDKVQSLTQSLSQSTGANEELQHQLSLLGDKLDRSQKDFAYRLCMLSAQQLGAGADNQGLNCAATSAGSPAPVAGGPGTLTPGAPLPPLSSSGTAGFAQAPNGNGGQAAVGRAPGVLGSLPAGPAPATRPTGPAQFDAAMNLLGKAQYSEASAAFRAYADANPDDDDLSSQSIYWVGNIAFVQQDYPNAARAFAEELKKYPDANRSPDAMLKLGQSLLAQGQTNGGCTTLALITKKYPKASASTLTAATGARKASCNK